MKNNSGRSLFCFVFLFAASFALGQPPEGTMAFTVSMEQPNTHYYHVVFRCEGMKGETQDFKMPAWTPGYYQIMDYARNVLNFRAEDGAGNRLAWEKTAKNTWRVKSGKAASVTVSYDVYAFARSVAESFLDDSRGFISPTGVFMHVAGRLGHPVTVSRQTVSRMEPGLDRARSGRGAAEHLLRPGLRRPLRLPDPRRQPGDPDVRGPGDPPCLRRREPGDLRPGEIRGRPQEDGRGGRGASSERSLTGTTPSW